MTKVVSLPVDQVFPNPDQPRKVFDQAELDSLAASIKENGLYQPIKVRPRDGGYEIVMGERRWRAHRLIGATTILACIEEMDDRSRDIAAIVENMHRADISPLEEARAFARMMQQYGMTEIELGAALGLTQPWRVAERVRLLKLEPEMQSLLSGNQISASAAYEMTKLSREGQFRLLDAIRRGDCDTISRIRAATTGIQEAEAQAEMFSSPAMAPTETENERRQLTALERKIDQLTALVAAGFDDGELAVAKRVRPDQARLYAERLKLIGRHVEMMQRALVQATVVTAELPLAS